MIRFDTLFPVLYAIIIAYAGTFITVAVEKRKNPKFKAKPVIILSTIIWLLLMSTAIIVYLWPNISAYFRRMSFIKVILPFWREEFSSYEFKTAYVFGAISFVGLWVVLIVFDTFSDPENFFVGIISLILVSLFSIFIGSWIEYWLTGTACSLLRGAPLWVVVVVNSIVSFIIPFLILHVISAVYGYFSNSEP